MNRLARPVGRWFDLDTDGCIVNPAQSEHVPVPVRPIVDQVGEVYRKRFGDALHSAYVRGSVVLGDAVPGIADLDTFGLVRAHPPERVVWWETPPWADREFTRLGTANGWLTSIDFAWASYHDDLGARNPTLAATIATQSLCIAGCDLRADLPPRRPGPDMFLDHLQIEQEVEWLEQVAHARKPYQADRARAVFKRIVRVGFELVMEEEGRYATSLYLCCESFCRYRPQHAAAMRTVLELYLARDPGARQPTTVLDDGVVLRLGWWLVGEAARELTPRSPLERPA
jgi:hypothetical protein